MIKDQRHYQHRQLQVQLYHGRHHQRRPQKAEKENRTRRHRLHWIGCWAATTKWSHPCIWVRAGKSKQRSKAKGTSKDEKKNKCLRPRNFIAKSFQTLKIIPKFHTFWSKSNKIVLISSQKCPSYYFFPPKRGGNLRVRLAVSALKGVVKHKEKTGWRLYLAIPSPNFFRRWKLLFKSSILFVLIG